MVKKGSNQLQQLVNLGLSRYEIEVYGLLLEKGNLPIKELAKHLDVFPNALYRVLNKLITKELVSAHGKSPTIYSAISPTIALELLTKKRIKQLEEMKQSVLTSLMVGKFPTTETSIDLIKNKQEFFQSYIDLAKEAKEEILVISKGEPVPDEIKLTNRDALERGVEFRMIAHKYDEENRNILHSYIKMEWQVRHFPDWGFHLFVIDANKAVLATNNPKNTDERTGFKIYSSGLAKALRDYFYSVWKKASEIK